MIQCDIYNLFTNELLVAVRQWIYQTCNEYGWYQTSSSAAQPFGTKFPLALFTTMCADLFGSQFGNSFIESRVAETNAYFGGLSPKVENVYLTHGQLDPWRAMGIQDVKQATIIPGELTYEGIFKSA